MNTCKQTYSQWQPGWVQGLLGFRFLRPWPDDRSPSTLLLLLWYRRSEQAVFQTTLEESGADLKTELWGSVDKWIRTCRHCPESLASYNTDWFNCPVPALASCLGESPPLLLVAEQVELVSRCLLWAPVAPAQAAGLWLPVGPRYAATTCRLHGQASSHHLRAVLVSFCSFQGCLQ